MEKKETVLFHDHYGNRIVRSDGSKRSVVKVINENGRTVALYRMNNIPFYEHSLLSWQNLDCCNGWWISEEDEAYLNTAVQKDKKLISEIVIAFPEFAEDPSPEVLYGAVRKKLTVLCPGLDSSHETWRIDRTFRYSMNEFKCNVTIIRKGCLADFYDATEIAAAYHRQSFPCVTEEELESYFHIELSELFPDADSIFSPCKTTIRDVLTGLALGYPIESTVHYICCPLS